MNYNVRGCGSHKLPKNPDKLDCTKFLYNLLGCYSITNIFRQYYRKGIFFDCYLEQTNYNYCMKAKFYNLKHDKEKANEILKKYRELIQSRQTPFKPIWEFKKNQK